MDLGVIDVLSKAGIRLDQDTPLPVVGIARDEEKRPVPMADDVPVVGSDDTLVVVRLKPIIQLFSGTRVPPDFADEPPPEYVDFFELIEITAVNYCTVTNRPERDVEFEAIYNHLRRRPDGKHANPLYSYLRAAVRLYMSISDVSQLEFEAVVDRLRMSAKHFAVGATSSNYYHTVRCDLGIDDGKPVPWPLNQMM